MLDVDANSDSDSNSNYGAAFGKFGADFGFAFNRRSTVIMLGEGHGNDPNLEAFAEITRRPWETICLVPKPRYSWGLGGCAGATCPTTRSTAAACVSTVT